MVSGGRVCGQADWASIRYLRRSFRPPLFGFPQRNQVGHFPQPVRHASGHRRACAQRAVNLDEVVRELAERNRGRVILNRFEKPFVNLV
jgi:hypothetical protein